MPPSTTIEHLKTTALTVPPLTALAWEINDAHQEVQDHAKGMLLAAKRAGEKLLEAKKGVPHGQFVTWIEECTNVNYRTARRYMQVAKMVASDHFDPDATIDSVLDTHASRRKKPTPAQPFTQADAEYAQPLRSATAFRSSTPCPPVAPSMKPPWPGIVYHNRVPAVRLSTG